MFPGINLKNIAARLSGLLKGKIASNALSLYAVQGINNLLSLLVMPFLLRALSPQGYGSIVFAQSLIGFAEVLTDFGFNFTAAREISIARGNLEEIARIYWITTAAKIFFFCLSIGLIFLVVFIVPRFREDWPVFAASSLILLGNVAFPKWYYQGLERLKEMALAQVIAKCVGTVSILLLVKSPDDLLMAAVVLSSPMLIGAISVVMTGRSLAPDLFYRPRISEVVLAIKESSHLFVASISTVLYLNTNSFVLGLVCGEKAVGLYGVGMRIVGTIQALATPFIQAVFPRASQLFAGQADDAGWQLVKRVSWIVFPAMLLVSLVVLLMAPQLVSLLGGKNYAEAVMSVRIMSIVPLLITIDKVLSEIIMVNIGLSRLLPKIYFFIGVINLALLWPLVSALEVNGAAISLVMAELVVIGLMLFSIKSWRSSELKR